MKFGLVECEEKQLDQTRIFPPIAERLPGCMPEPRSEQHTPIETHRYRHHVLPFRCVVAVSLDDLMGELCAGPGAELGNFAVVNGCAIGAELLVPIELRAAAAMFRQAEVDDA